MIRRIFIENPAKADIAGAYTWYKEIRPDLRDDFRACLRTTFRRIADLPEAYPVVGKKFRRTFLPKFSSYGIYYLIDGAVIRIFAVMHTSRDPAIWRAREH